ncbi:hypothetical protein [Winogradskyella sp. SM1960]|uniref:hypothetical protein n=1 Tax=Winogradskyella sp. SM1960 TaxID=2865955 RepID=UPI001CD33301|nr:hypothetical protein [Winogradskyella sp. SM1960]
MNIEQTLDKTTSELLSELRKEFRIDFQEKNINHCEVFTQNRNSIICFNPNIVDNESIAHELLHIWLNKYNYIIGSHIYLSFQSDWKLSKIFNKFLCDYIENCFDHYKMYPKYLEMGYSPEKFIMNGLEEKCSIEDIKKLHLKFLSKYKPDSINRFIGYLISIYADHIDNTYDEHLNLLEKKEPKLFRIVTEFWNKWTEFDIENIDAINNSDLELAESFMTEMKEWIEFKKVK